MKKRTFTTKIILILTVFLLTTVSAVWAQSTAQAGRTRQDGMQQTGVRPIRTSQPTDKVTPKWKIIDKLRANKPAWTAMDMNKTQRLRTAASGAKEFSKPSFSRLKNEKMSPNALRDARNKRKMDRLGFLARTRKNGPALRRSGDDPLTRLYVDQAAPFASVQDGSSWGDAFFELSDALKYANDHPDVTEIWVAYGVYHPQYYVDYTDSGDERDYAFVLPPNVKIYGGFYGVEEALGERDLRNAEDLGFLFGTGSLVNATILSGDLLGDDGYDDDPFSFTNDNTHHVVISSGPVGDAGLDGVVIIGGNANENSSLELAGYEDVSRAAGGGIALYNSSPTLTNLVIYANQAASGSAIYASESSPVITNTLVIGNGAATGTLYLENSMSVITNATITDNTAANAAGIYFTGAIDPSVIRNTIIYGNTASANPNILVNGGVAPSYAFCIVGGSGGSVDWDPDFGTNGGANMDVDPKFSNPAFQLYNLSMTSPAINAGNNEFFQSGEPDLSGITTDLRGITRITNGVVDIGAIESLYNVYSTELLPTDGRLYVKKGSDGDGSSWLSPAGELADALFAAALNPDVQEIWVAGGVYHPLYRPDNFSNANPNGKFNAFLMVPNVKIYGGFNGDEDELTDRDLSITANASILSADFNEDDEFDVQELINADEISPALGENAIHLVYAVGDIGDAVLDGFTIEGTNVLSAAFDDMDSGGFEFLNESLFINGVDIPFLLGGAVASLGTNMTLSNLTVRNNLGLIGGGVFMLGFETNINNSLIYNNVTAMFGSGVVSFETNLNMVNVTVTENYGITFFGLFAGVTVAGGVSKISNSIIYGHGDECCPVDLYTDIVSYFGEELAISHSVIGGSNGSGPFWETDMGTDGGGNLDEDPVFKDVLAKDFSLSPCSRAIDAGTNVYYEGSETPDLTTTLTDLAGNPRIYNSIVDMGAFEFQSAPSADVPLLAGDGRVSDFEFTSPATHVFTVPSGICTSDLLALTPIELTGLVYAVSWLDPKVRYFNGAPYVQRHFDIEPMDDPDNASARVTLYFTQADFDAFNAHVSPLEYLPTGDPEGEGDRISNLRIFQFHGLTDDWSGDPSSYVSGSTTIDPDDEDIVWNSALSRWEVSFDVQAFSGFFAGTKTQSPLPVRLVSFLGKLKDNNTVQLDWHVAEQDQIDSYIVEHSANGKQFNEVGKVFANSQSDTQYRFTDEVPRLGQYAYYRLRIMEMDGKKSYSRIAAVKLPFGQRMVVYPVPAKTHVWVNWKGSSGNTAELIDIVGRVIKTIPRLEDMHRVDISGLTPGIYILKMADGGTVKILKE